MNKTVLRIGLAALVGTLLLAAAGCSAVNPGTMAAQNRQAAQVAQQAPNDQSAVVDQGVSGANDTLAGNGYGKGAGNAGSGIAAGSSNASGTGITSALDAASSADLSQAEVDALNYLREEEKLAHDVYVALYEKWNLQVFQNISQSESAHTDSVKALLDRCTLADPAQSQAGVFTNPELQTLYDQLVAQGSQSLADALKVGAAIEEIDILDLKDSLLEIDNEDIQLVFNQLMSGSENHLSAFISTLQRQTGEVYQPQYLSQAEYDAILSSLPGNRGRGQGNGQGNGNGNGSSTP